MFDIGYNDPIDVVIMWVDGSDDEFIQSERNTLKKEKELGKNVVHAAARHRDNGELRYLLRGINENMPWVRNIYLVTNGQKPPYVNFDLPGISLVSHAEIFPDSCFLPNFNTFAIESCLNNIVGLSNNYIRFSDDFFVFKKMSKNEYIDVYSKYIFKGRVQEDPISAYQEQLKINSLLMESVVGIRPSYNFAHSPQIRNRRIFDSYLKSFEVDIQKTRGNKFRSKSDIISLFLYPYYALQSWSPSSIGKMRNGYIDDCVFVQEGRHSEIYSQVLIGKDGEDWIGGLESIIVNAPAYFNLNDAFNRENKEFALERMTEFLQSIYPIPSPWECN